MLPCFQHNFSINLQKHHLLFAIWYKIDNHLCNSLFYLRRHTPRAHLVKFLKQPPFYPWWARGLARIWHWPSKPVIAGSNPAAPAKHLKTLEYFLSGARGLVVMTSASQAEGRRFESGRAHLLLLRLFSAKGINIGMLCFD